MTTDNLNIDFNKDKKDQPDGEAGDIWDVIDHLQVPDLLALRSKIDHKLPATALKDLNLEEELVIQFLGAKTLRDSSVTDAKIPANQKAQLMNTCASILSQMAKSQTELYSAERIKRMEMALIDTLRDLDEAVLEKFLIAYEELLEQRSGNE